MVEKLQKHKHLVAIMAILLVLAGSYIWNQTQYEKVQTVNLPVSRKTEADAQIMVSAATVATPLAEYQEKRDKARKEDISALETLAQNSLLTATAREQAQEELREIVRCRESELAIEGALLGGGVSPLVAVVQKGAVTVLVEKEELTQTEATMILAVATAHSGEPPENVRIIAGNLT